MVDIPITLARVFESAPSPQNIRRPRLFRGGQVMAEPPSPSNGYLSAKQKIEKCAGSSSLFELMELIPATFDGVIAVELATADARPGYTRYVRGFTDRRMMINHIVPVSSGDECESLRHAVMTDIVLKTDEDLADNLMIFSKRELSVQDASESETLLIMNKLGALFSDALHTRIGALTLLPNSAAFEAAAQAAEAAFMRESKEFSIILADIDDLKQLNTTHGYAAGDIVLAGVADRFRDELAVLGYKGSVVFRPGKSKFLHGARKESEAGANPSLKHDEFAVLLQMPAAEAAKIADWLRLSVAGEPFSLDLPLEDDIRATCSFGIASSAAGVGWRKMLDECVLRLGAAKKLGGNAIVP